MSIGEIIIINGKQFTYIGNDIFVDKEKRRDINCATVDIENRCNDTQSQNSSFNEATNLINNITILGGVV